MPLWLKQIIGWFERSKYSWACERCGRKTVLRRTVNLESGIFATNIGALCWQCWNESNCIERYIYQKKYFKHELKHKALSEKMKRKVLIKVLKNEVGT